MRELDSTDLGLAFIRGMRANATREQTAKYTPAIGDSPVEPLLKDALLGQ